MASPPARPSQQQLANKLGTASKARGLTSEGTLSESAFNIVATCNAGVSSCSTTCLKFMLAPNATIRRAGSYTIGLTWKVESIGT